MNPREVESGLTDHPRSAIKRENLAVEDDDDEKEPLSGRCRGLEVELHFHSSRLGSL